MQQRKWFLPFILFSLLVSLGCATSIPFLGINSESTPVEMVDADTLATLVAESVAQKVTQTLAALPPTLIPTALPTETPLPSPTPTATNTPTQVPYPESGSEFKEDIEGNPTYLDYSGGYTVNLPTDWLAIRPGETEYTAAWSLPEATRPEVQSALQSMQSLDPNSFRLFILDTRAEHAENSFLTNINLLLSPESDATLEEVFAQNVLDLPKAIPGLVVTDSTVETTTSKQDVGIIISEWDSKLSSGETVHIYQKQAIFTVKNHSLVITFTSTVDFKDTVLAEFDALLADFTLLN